MLTSVFSRCLISLLVFSILSSCDYGKKIYLFKEEGFDNKANWLIVLADNYTKVQVINDKALISKNYTDVWARINNECLGTTSDNTLYLYKTEFSLTRLAIVAFRV